MQDKQLALQDKRLGDFSAVAGIDAGRFGAIATLLAGLITAVVVVFTFSTSSQAVAAAKLEVEPYKEKFDKLMQESKDAVTDVNDTLKMAEANTKRHLSEITRLHDKIEQIYNKAVDRDAKHKALFADAERRLTPQTAGTSAPPPDPANEAALAEAADKAAKLPESERGFDEWYLIGLAAHDKGDYLAARYAFNRAEDIAPDIVARARAMNSRARTEYIDGKYDAAAALWQRVLDSYERLVPQNPELERQIELAQFGKDFVQGDLG